MTLDVGAVHREGDVQIGGPSGWVAGKVSDAMGHTRVALEALKADPTRSPIGAPHPREAAIASAREAVLHLNEALSVEAPEDAIVETRHALEELTTSIAVLERLRSNPSVKPGELPVAAFERAIERLAAAESNLHLVANPDLPPVYGLEGATNFVVGVDAPPPMTGGNNSGIVPPWMQVIDDEYRAIGPLDPETPRIMETTPAG